MVAWRNKTVRLQAKLVPRFLWLTASIDLFVGEERILRTGGQFKVNGSQSAKFTDGGSEHEAVLTWGQVRQRRFPCQLQIDGVILENADVEIENPSMGYIPVVIAVALLIWITHLILATWLK